jgi:hypothetical protein
MEPLSASLQIGEPVKHRGITIAPLFPRRSPRARYVTLDEALPLGFRIAEVSAAGLVPELIAHNPLDTAVLLYDGEELVGAKQNRILNVTALVGAKSDVRIPVSCVEQGRWSTRSAAFAAAEHASYPELRRRKAEMLLEAPLEPAEAQSAVWDSVAAKSARMQAFSPTGAQADIFTARTSGLDALRRAFPLQPGQAGSVAAFGSRPVCLDYLSRPEAFARLYPKLLDGYLLDAIEQPVGDGGIDLQAFVERVLSAPRRPAPSVSLGEDIRLASDGIVGSGLEFDGELVQLSAFSSEGARPRTRLMRPSLRR